MRKTLLLILPLTLVVSVAQAAEPECGRPSEIKGSLSRPADDAAHGMAIGRSAATCGYDWSAANVLEREVARRPTPLARFNLAAVYAKTGREAAAADLYRSVQKDGRRFWVVLDSAPGDPVQTRVNLAQEAAERAAELTAPPRLGALSTGALSVEAAATEVSTLEGAPAARISDAEALQRDGL
jgi:hypothetical protein